MGLIDFDNNVIFINLETLEEFFDLNPKKRNLEIYLKDPKDIENQKKLFKKSFQTNLFIVGLI